MKYNKDNFTTLMIKKELKNKLEDLIITQPKKMSYPQILEMLIDVYYQHEDKIKNELFNNKEDERI